MTLADARELVELAARHRLVYAVGFMKRYDPGRELARKLILGLNSTQELGSCKMVDIACFLGDWLQNPGEPLTTDEPFPKDDFKPRYPEFLAAALRNTYDHFTNVFSHNVMEV
ncbi:unnamed protein product [marine sediment metagenome]|uniref:Uncharacterized protein n=1 Tax=marine sediment metagenome TaxID=412755 RepID=X1P845_9ZZZZ